MKSLLLLLLLAGMAPDQPKVMKFLRESLTVYDETGTLVGKEPKWDLPKGGATIEQIDAAGRYGILHDGKRVFLRPSEVETAGVVEVSCAGGTAAASASGRHVAASEGVSSGVGLNGTMCVRK